MVMVQRMLLLAHQCLPSQRAMDMNMDESMLFTRGKIGLVFFNLIYFDPSF